MCGASEDIAGFDSSVTERGIRRLMQWNHKVVPVLEGLKPFHRWAGLRPSTLDGQPLIGRLPHADRVLLAAGHYRNGILLSPVTAMLAADCAEGKPSRHGSRRSVPTDSGRRSPGGCCWCCPRNEKELPLVS